MGESSGERGLVFGIPKSRATRLGPTEAFRKPGNPSALLINPSPTMKIVKYVGLDVHANPSPSPSPSTARKSVLTGPSPPIPTPSTASTSDWAVPALEIRYVYEAGPTGFALCRHLRARGIVCEVVSPSLVPKPASQRIKTDRRDAATMARLFRSGELTFIRVPDEADEAIRDLVRARLAAVEDQRRARQRIKGFLLRHGRRYSGKTSWTAGTPELPHKQVFPFPAQQLAFEEHVRAADGTRPPAWRG